MFFAPLPSIDFRTTSRLALILHQQKVKSLQDFVRLTIFIITIFLLLKKEDSAIEQVMMNKSSVFIGKT
jgi:hypothetical protein